jgi:hypothetical protein
VSAIYKYSTHMKQTGGDAFDAITPVGKPAPFSGIYRCEGCGHMISSTKGNTLPPQNHPQHSPSQGAIRWRLIVGHN